MCMEYKVVFEGGTAELVEKKSRFLATVFPVASDEEAVACMGNVKKEHWNARHHCYAYVCGEKSEVKRFSDDGEPGGTAGRPILEVLCGEGVTNTLIVVTRYFGGTLLGTGGLVRAYGNVAKQALNSCNIITKVNGCKRKIDVDYQDVGKIQYILENCRVGMIQATYMEAVSFDVVCRQNEEKEFCKKLTEATAGRAKISGTEDCCFAYVDGELLLFH